MPKYTVKAIERFLVETTYEGIEANSPEEAERIAKLNGSYDHHSMVDDPGEWVTTESVEEEEDN